MPKKMEDQVHLIDSSAKPDAPAATNGGGRPKRNLAPIVYNAESPNDVKDAVKKKRPTSKKTVKPGAKAESVAAVEKSEENGHASSAPKKGRKDTVPKTSESNGKTNGSDEPPLKKKGRSAKATEPTVVEMKETTGEESKNGDGAKKQRGRKDAVQKVEEAEAAEEPQKEPPKKKGRGVVAKEKVADESPKKKRRAIKVDPKNDENPAEPTEGKKESAPQTNKTKGRTLKAIPIEELADEEEADPAVEKVIKKPGKATAKKNEKEALASKKDDENKIMEVPKKRGQKGPIEETAEIVPAKAPKKSAKKTADAEAEAVASD